MARVEMMKHLGNHFYIVGIGRKIAGIGSHY